jgi:hypothetical protein
MDCCVGPRVQRAVAGHIDVEGGKSICKLLIDKAQFGNLSKQAPDGLTGRYRGLMILRSSRAISIRSARVERAGARPRLSRATIAHVGLRAVHFLGTKRFLSRKRAIFPA